MPDPVLGALRDIRRQVRVLGIATLLLYLLLASGGIVSVVWQSRDLAQQCENAQLNRTAIREQILAGFDSVGYRYEEQTGALEMTGTELAYYRAQPEERARQLRNLLASIERFPTIEC